MKAIRKRYRKTKWIDTHFSKEYMQELASASLVTTAQIGSAVSLASSKASIIAHQTDVPPSLVAVALVNHSLSTTKEISELIELKNRRLKAIKLKWGVKA